MPQLSDAVLFWILIATQAAGVLGTLVARLGERSWGAAVFQRTFFISLAAIALSTVLAISLQPGSWLSGAAMLGLMAVGATLDFDSQHQNAAEF